MRRFVLGDDVCRDPAALQDIINLLAGAGTIPAPYSVAPPFSPAEDQRYNTILKEAVNNG
jgi:hypothetical protein